MKRLYILLLCALSPCLVMADSWPVFSTSSKNFQSFLDVLSKTDEGKEIEGYAYKIVSGEGYQAISEEYESNEAGEYQAQANVVDESAQEAQYSLKVAGLVREGFLVILKRKKISTDADTVVDLADSSDEVPDTKKDKDSSKGCCTIS